MPETTKPAKSPKNNKKQGNNKKRDNKNQRKKGAPKWKNVVAEIEGLKKRIAEEVPPPGVLYYKYKAKDENEEQNQEAADDSSKLNTKSSRLIANRKVLETDDKTKIKIRFSDLPISKATNNGLYKAKFIKMTEVQRAAISHAIAGRDVVVSARTGSGKTLSYLVPIVERLYHERWSSMDGLGALILVPVRELALQAFEVLRSFGAFHDLSAGLAIGGKDLNYEQERIRGMNILICTPGRLLQHMNESEGLDTSNLKMLVIDEVDRILDMGFKDTMEQIMRNLPKKTQTMLFSATVGKILKDMARVNLKPDHEYICIHDYDSIESLANDYNPNASAEDKMIVDQLKSITPVKLLHFYMVINIEDKLDTLFSFLKSHQKNKCIVFFSACKQVRFAYEAFKRLKLGMIMLELHGRQKQTKRTAIYYEFVERKQAVLFCTDVASRGIDFPAVDWVVQYDCPEDLQTYIHRVGRTARYKSKGNALLFSTPAETKFIDKIQQRGIQLKKLNANPNQALTIQPTLQKLNAENRDVKHLAEKACISYIKSIYLMKDKETFKFNELDCEKLAYSLGLANAPQIGFIQKNNQKNTARENAEDDEALLDIADEIDSMKIKPGGDKKLSRLQILRQKIKEKKEAKKVVQDQELLLKRQMLASLVEDDEDEDEEQDDESDSEESEDNQSDEESDEGDFFTSKKNQREFDNNTDDDEQIIHEEEDNKLKEEIRLNELKINKKKLRKITKDGPLQGKNKVFFGSDGKPITSLEYHLLQDKQKHEKKTVKDQSESEQSEVEQQDPSTLRLFQESEVDDDSEAEGRFIGKVKNQLQKSEAQDKQLARQKLTEQRLKKKRKMKDRLRGKDDEDGPVVAVIGGASDEEDQDQSADNNQNDQSDEEESDQEKKVKANKKRRRLSVQDSFELKKQENSKKKITVQDSFELKKQEQNKKKNKALSGMSEEQRALALLERGLDF